MNPKTALVRKHRERAREHGQVSFSEMLPKAMLEAMDIAAKRIGAPGRRALLIRLFEANPNMFDVDPDQGAMPFALGEKRKAVSGANR